MIKNAKCLLKIYNHLKIDTRTLISLPDFTKNNYGISRGHYRTLEEHHINTFRQMLDENSLIMDLCDLEKYNVDWFHHLRGASALVLKPRTTEQVSKILSYCNKHLLAVCIQGGNTGVVGGATAVYDEIIISTELMNQVIQFDETSGVLLCQAGCILENLDTFLEQYGYRIPLDIGSKGSCQIGGNVATNAGGLRLLRYGNMHGNVLGLEAVKADGQVLDTLSVLRKDNTGFHLKNIFIGSEGCLGLITKVAIQCRVRSNSTKVAFLGVQNFTKVIKIFNKAKQELAEVLSAIELMDFETICLVKEHANLSSPIGEYPFYLLVEVAGSDSNHDQEKLEKFLESGMASHLFLNGIVASESKKIDEIWSIRERIPENLAKDGYVYLYDFSLPLSKYYELVNEMKDFMSGKSHRVFGFGHLGDNNLHLHISTKQYSKDVKNYIEPHIYKRVAEMNGSISAEHGIGFTKRKFLSMFKPQPAMELMKNLKQLLDPNQILNPYKVI